MTDKKRDTITRELIEREQLLTAGRLTAGVAHDINNPAAFVSANLNELGVAAHELERLLLAALPLAFRAAGDAQAAELRRLLEQARHPAIFEDMQAMVQESLEGMRRIRDTVNGLRELSILNEAPSVLDLRQLAQSALGLLHSELRHRAHVRLSTQPTPAVLAPRGRVLQVLIGLLLSALRRLEGRRGGELTLSTGRTPEGDALVVIRDSGRVLPAAPGDPATPRWDGGGLPSRLAISRGIARSLGGSLEVISGPEGSTATLRLPAHIPLQAPSPEALSHQAPGDPLLDASLLVVDDEEPILRSLTRLLRRARRVRTAASGEEALEILLTEEPPDLILCDIIMPGLSGMALYRRVGAERPELLPRFLFMTGGALTPDSEHFCELHAQRVIEKPFEHEELRQRIRRALQTL